jgi:hypothetical protein
MVALRRDGGYERALLKGPVYTHAASNSRRVRKIQKK